MLAPIEASARAGGFGGARGSAPGGIHTMTAKPSGIHPGRAMRFHHRRPFRHGEPLQWDLPYSDSADYSAPYTVWYGPLPDEPTARPVVGTAATPRHISAVDRPSICNSQTMKVPSESGGERAITVTRC